MRLRASSFDLSGKFLTSLLPQIRAPSSPGYEEITYDRTAEQLCTPTRSTAYTAEFAMFFFFLFDLWLGTLFREEDFDWRSYSVKVAADCSKRMECSFK